MDNLKRPAYAQPMATLDDGNVITSWQHHEYFAGFTKLEKATLMIAGHIAQTWGGSPGHEIEIARISRALAEAVIEECNK